MMTVQRLREIALKSVGRFVRLAESETRDRRNVELVLAALLQRADPHFPVAYVETLRGCLETQRPRVDVVKRGSHDPRFQAVVNALRDLPPVSSHTAEQVARVADDYRNNATTKDSGALWSGDVRAHFELSSSFGSKGRILTAAVRFGRAQVAVELGTAYGLSAMFLLEAAPELRLTTVELSELQHALASELLTKRYGSRVTCVRSRSQDALAHLTPGSVDLVFHDAGHSRDDYVGDFGAMLPALTSNAIVLIDDIRWDGRGIVREDPRSYEGWREVVAHPRVAEAVEMNGEVGVLRVV